MVKHPFFAESAANPAEIVEESYLAAFTRLPATQEVAGITQLLNQAARILSGRSSARANSRRIIGE